MSGEGARPNVGHVLAGLKDFQRTTVDHVFRHLYLEPTSSHRFLIADEVGLGKTLVARGVIAKAVDFLWDKVGRIDVVYICSNADIARQNIKRLGLGADEFSLPSRITLLPISVHNLDRHRVNFISFTPNTSFNLRSNLGLIDERALLYLLLRPAWNLGNRSGPLNLLQGNAGRVRFRGHVRWFRRTHTIDDDLAADFITRLNRRILEEQGAGRPTLRERFDDLSDRFQYSRKRVPWHERDERNRLVGDLRTVLAETCLEALEPDLVILDEFQRFKHLLGDEDASSELAQQLFEYVDHEQVDQQVAARVLLLSATPYKMYTTAGEPDEDHYSDFVDTLEFLLRDPAKTARVEQLLTAFRDTLHLLGQGRTTAISDLHSDKQELEAILRQVMVRTERLTSTEDRNGMLIEILGDGSRLDENDLAAYLGLQRVADLLGEPDLLEYWKSAPYLLEFMDHYKYKERFKEALTAPERQMGLAAELAANGCALFPWREWRSYQTVDPENAKLRSLLDQTTNTGVWRLLWIPASLPYYQPAGVFAEDMARNFTKRLIFSSWHVVPKVIASMLSYEAERHMVRSFQDDAENSPEARQRIRPLLRFAVSRERLTGMPVLALLYPSVALAHTGDPLRARRTADDSREPPSMAAVLESVKAHIMRMLADIPHEHGTSGVEDERWYWAAPILLDLQADPNGTRAWFERDELAAIWASHSADDSGEESTHWGEHVDEARDVINGRIRLGRQPADLPDVLARLALAGPATAILRSLARPSTSEDPFTTMNLRDDAARAAWAFRALFNHPEVTMLIRSLFDRGPYWRRVLDYCAQGNLQAVLDEYTHVLQEYLGLAERSFAEATAEIAGALLQSVTLRTATVSADEISIADNDHLELHSHRMRVRFALRFGDQQSERTGAIERAGTVRAAFNSPFWPFVLATTSVGQEGLDFHLYCHAVVHWNLPSNPVDLEQREGRVHRYKNHAVRKNLTDRFGREALNAPHGDPWSLLFDIAHRKRDPAASDLIPYWIFPIPDGAQIERHVPALPLTRDRERLASLRRALTVYRMAFGQPRQEDLVDFLIAHVSEELDDTAIDQLRIDLSPNSEGL